MTRLGALVLVGLAIGCGPDDSSDGDGTGGGGAAGAGGKASVAGSSGSAASGTSGASGGGSGGSTGGGTSGGGSGGTGGGSAGSTGSGGALTGQAWKDFMFQSYCPAACDKTMALPCYGGASTAQGCLNECYAYWTNAYMICPAAVPPLTQCGFPSNVSYSCVGDMVAESFADACSDEADAVSACN